MLVMAMELTSSTLTMLKIPSSCHPPSHIGGGPPSKRRRRSSNNVCHVPKTSVDPKVQGSVTFHDGWRVPRQHADNFVGNLAKIKVLEACIIAYVMRDPFIIPILVYEYAGAVKYHWGKCALTRVYMLSHWLKVFLCVVAQFQRDSYKNFSDDEDIISC